MREEAECRKLLRSLGEKANSNINKNYRAEKNNVREF